MGSELVIPIRALEHFSYCPRQCALIHGDGVWSDNRHTVVGTHAHRRVDSGATTTGRGKRTLRSVPLWSETFGLTGRTDAIEISPDGSVMPVEYKAGRRHGQAADVQLCAQALCLEEMLGVVIPVGALWFGGTRRRVPVDLDADLRGLTIERIKLVREALLAPLLPSAPNDARCTECQLEHHCLPSVVTIDQVQLRELVHDEVFACDI